MQDGGILIPLVLFQPKPIDIYPNIEFGEVSIRNGYIYCAKTVTIRAVAIVYPKLKFASN